MGIEGISLVSIEISNRCPVAERGEHPECPARLSGPPAEPYRSMPTPMVLGILTDLGLLNYAGRVIFSIYNEPLADPRFFWFAEQLRDLVPKATLRLLTNSVNLNSGLADDLARHRCVVECDAYTKAEARRLKDEGLDVFTVCERHRDNRIHLYDRPKHGRTDLSPCTTWDHLTIFHTGEICICNLDFRRKNVLGDLRKERLSTFLSGNVWAETTCRLKAGERWMDLCQRCEWERGRFVL